MLIILYITRLNYTVNDIKYCFSIFEPEDALERLSDSSVCFIFLHIAGIFMVSICKFLEVL